MPTITPEQLVQQWATVRSKFDLNIWNFETVVGDAAQRIFKQSFFLQRFNDSGSMPWRQRSDKRGRLSHPILNETGALKNSIQWSHMSVSKGSTKGVKIYTDMHYFRGINTRHPGFCYAAIHNASDGTYKYGKTGVPSIQRQFIGHSAYLNDAIKREKYRIFEGFPKT